MTNREAFNAYCRVQMENSIRSVEKLPDIAFYLWQNKYRDANCGTKIGRDLNWFWFTYGGRDIGRGIDNVIKWFGMEFNYDFDAEAQKWKDEIDGYASEWAKDVMKEFELH